MHFTHLTTSLLATASLASARIIGISAPSTLTPNTTFPLTLLTENYIQTVADISVAWGYSIPPGYPFSLGSYTSSSYLGPEKSNTLENVTVQATVPEGLASESWYGKEVVLSAGVYSLYGASGAPTVTGWNVTVRIGEANGTEGGVRSERQGWIENGGC